jgi:hypothetical protein
VAGFANIPNIHCCSKWESVKGKELLGKHLDNQIQMGCQYVFKIILLQPRFEKHLSSFTLPITMATNSSFNFSHLNNRWEINWLLDKVVEIFVHGLQSIRSFMVAWQLLNILKKDDCCTNNVSSNKGGIYNCFGPMICFQNSNVLSKLKIVLKIYV